MINARTPRYLVKIFGDFRMRGWGIFLICGGVVFLLIALNMDTSVETGGGLYVPSRVQNIGLIADRQTYIFLSGLVILIGALMAIFGGPKQQVVAATISAPAIPASDSPPCERDLSLDGYRLWLASRYAIARNEVFDRFVFDNQTFESLDAALAEAHAREQKKIAEMAEWRRQQEAESEQLAAAQEEVEAETRKILKVSAVILTGVVLICGPLFYFQAKDAARVEAARAAEERKKVADALAEWDLKIPEGWVQTEITNEPSDDQKTFCGDRTGTLVRAMTQDSPVAVVKSFDDQLGEGTNPFSGVTGAGESESRVYKKKGGRELHLYASTGMVWVCDVPKA